MIWLEINYMSHFANVKPLLTFLMCRLTFCDNALEVDDVGVVKLSHDAGLRQEVKSVLVRGSSF